MKPPRSPRRFGRGIGAAGIGSDAVAVGLGQLSALLYPLVSIPLLARVLGPAELGRLILAIALLQLVIYVVDYGFGMSALRRVAVSADVTERGRILASTLAAKIMLYAGCAVVLLPVIFLVPGLREAWPVHVVGLALVFGVVMFPDWLLQGLGRMKAFAVITAVSRFAALGGLLLTVNSADDTVLAMFWQFAPFGLSALLCWWYLRHIGEARVTRTDVRAVTEALRDGWPLFVSNLAIMVISSGNTIVLGAVSGLSQVAFYGAAERMANAARGVLGGIQDAMLPRMALAVGAGKSEESVGVRRFISVGLASSFGAAGLALVLLADPVVLWYLGEGFHDSVPMARLLGLALILTGGTAAFTLSIVAQHRFTAMTRVVSITAVFHLVILIPACALGGGLGAACAVVVSEALMVTLYVIDYLRHRRGSAPAGGEPQADVEPSGDLFENTDAPGDPQTAAEADGRTPDAGSSRPLRSVGSRGDES